MIRGLLYPGYKIASRITTVASSVWVPSTIGNFLAGWKADALSLSNNDPVSSWTDSSGNSRHATQGTGARQPTFKTAQINSLPAVQFDGSNDILATAAFSIPETWHVFAVCKTSVNAIQNVVDFDHGSAPRICQMRYNSNVEVNTIGFDTVPNAYNDTEICVSGDWIILESERTSSSVITRVNGVTGTASGTMNTNNSGSQTVNLGAFANDTQVLNGFLAEALLYGANLSVGDALTIRQYMSTKYGIAI